jgi:hypothetical protein
MSGPRRRSRRSPLAFGIAGVAVWFCALSSCTMRTPDYCNKDEDCASQYCETRTHYCKVKSDASSVIDDDAGTDVASDMRVTTDGGPDVAPDAPADTTSPGDAAGDRRDAVVDLPPPTCVSVPPALCSGAKPVCDTAHATCVECLKNDDCHGATTPVCDTAVNKCVQCILSADCKIPSSSICQNQVCRGCLADSECAGIGPEVCMVATDQHCATDDETVYVRNGGTPACSDTDRLAGTKTTPFCRSQPAIGAALTPPLPADAGAPDAGQTGTDGGVSDSGRSTDGAAADGAVPPDTRARTLKTLVVMLGSNALTDFTFDGGSRTLTVVGKSATIGPGPSVGITVTSGRLYARDLVVTSTAATTPGTGFTGVVVTGGEIHFDRMAIKGNALGGIRIDNASFEITNSIIAHNGETQLASNTLVTWSGIVIGKIPSGGMAQLLNTTIADNGVGPLACSETANPVAPHLAGLLFWNNAPTVDILGSCTETPCCGTSGARVDPGFVDRINYRLSSTSMCRDKVAAPPLTPFDIDGETRPYNGLSDCGADEFHPPPTP